MDRPSTDFPLPVSPMIPVTCWEETVRLTWLTAGIVPEGVEKLTQRSWMHSSIPASFQSMRAAPSSWSRRSRR